MSSSPSFRWRTIVEVGVISAVIYIFLGTPGLRLSSSEKSTTHSDVPIAKAKTESLVYPSKDLECPRHDFDIHIFSTSPLVVYVDGFLGDQEAEHLIGIRFVHGMTIDGCIANKKQLRQMANLDSLQRRCRDD